MNNKDWTFTAYENGKPVATEEHLNDNQAIVALRTAIFGELGLKAATEPESQVAEAVAERELARAA